MSKHLEFHFDLRTLAFLAVCILWMAAGCGGGNAKVSITVFAAASLTDAFTDIGAEFEREYPEIEVKLNFAGSQRLRSQMELGARADIFASADETQMSLAEEAGLISGRRQTFALAGMAVIANSESDIQQVEDLATEGVKLVLAHENVPSGHYARVLLERLSASDSGFGPEFGAQVLDNVVSEETSVKFVEQKVVLGQADAGIVYRPGALTSVDTGMARDLVLPDQVSEVRAVYPIAVAKEADQPELAASFVEFVLSSTAQDILAGYGFDAP